MKISYICIVPPKPVEHPYGVLDSSLGATPEEALELRVKQQIWAPRPWECWLVRELEEGEAPIVENGFPYRHVLLWQVALPERAPEAPEKS